MDKKEQQKMLESFVQVQNNTSAPRLLRLCPKYGATLTDCFTI